MKTVEYWRDAYYRQLAGEEVYNFDAFINAVQTDARDSALEDAATCLQPYEAASIRALKGKPK